MSISNPTKHTLHHNYRIYQFKSATLQKYWRSSDFLTHKVPILLFAIWLETKASKGLWWSKFTKVYIIMRLNSCIIYQCALSVQGMAENFVIQYMVRAHNVITNDAARDEQLTKIDCSSRCRARGRITLLWNDMMLSLIVKWQTAFNCFN